MATFTHDPSRVHPPATRTVGYPSIAAEEATRQIPSNEGFTVAFPVPASSVADTPRDAASGAPRTLPIYSDGQTLLSVALGGSGEPHRVIYITVARDMRGQGLAKAMMQTALDDMDADGRDCVVAINNVDVDCDPDRLAGFFTKYFGFLPVEGLPEYGPHQYRRPTAKI